MIAAWMLYCIGIALAFVVVGHALERGFHLAGRPTRWAWIIALAGSCLVPVAAWVRPEAFAALALPLPEAVVVEPSAMPPTPAAGVGAVATAVRGFSLSDLDALLRWSWAVASVVLLMVLALAALRLAALRRQWRRSRVDGRLILVSRDVGPAVVGFWRPRVVIPEWALMLPAAERALMLTHEEEHVRTGDPWLLVLGAVALVLAPWNPALWWHVRRLRLAVEIDCDARVLAGGGSAPTYGELLLQVGRRRTRLPLGAPAFGEPASFLERRIRRIVTALPRWRWAGAALALAVAAGAMVAACETPRPVAPAPGVQASSMDTVTTAQVIDVKTRALVDSVMAERLRPWVRENIARAFPSLLEQPAGPPMDVLLVHDSRLRVSQASLTPDGGNIDSERIAALFKGFRPGNDGWSVVDRRVLAGTVRENVRVIRVHHEPRSRDLSAFREHPEMAVLPWIREGITRFYPSLLRERGGPPLELWFVADARKQVLRTLQRPGNDHIAVGIDEIHAVFPELSRSNVYSWRVTNRGGLWGLVRDNVRVIWVQVREGTSVPGSDAPNVPPEGQAPGSGRPEILSAPPLEYPALLHHAGIQGRVIVQAIIDTIGRAEPGSVRVLQSPNPGFNESAKTFVLHARFRPAQKQGRAVRVFVSVPVDFTMKG